MVAIKTMVYLINIPHQIINFICGVM
uniref:Uncharacterized protein n=1 Tax=Arundo donax TaxID=35708 RepID=A0A0A9FLR4_ARUDO